MKNTQATEFKNKWTGRGDEKSDTQTFWNELIGKVLDGPNVEIDYEKRVVIDGQTKFIDGYLPDTKTLIEQKTITKDLSKKYAQSGGLELTPFEQAKRYANNLPHNEHPRWIIVSNFKEIRVHDMNKPGEAPEIIKLEDIEKDYTRLGFLVDKDDENIAKELEVSVKAGELVGKIYDALLEQYVDPENEDSLKSLNILCVRLVFCLYAEDALIFGKPNRFHDYLSKFNNPNDFRKALIELFRILNQKSEDRDPYGDPELLAFPYVNGGLFAKEDVEIPRFTPEIMDILLSQASKDFDWSDISPTIFGAVFESTLNPETRRQGGMHYTSIENIHKVIDPLFLDDLKNELKEIKKEPVDRTRIKNLKAFQDKLASLKFMDPACGSGNFCTESYLSLRRLENEVLKETLGDQISMIFDEEKSPVKVSIDQFYGIEINDFAVDVAKTALWIAESQMLEETEKIVHHDIDFLPLTTNAYIVHGNALRMDWNEVCPASELNYIMGNPPFVGKKEQTKEQKKELLELFPKNIKGIGNLDFVAGWYQKATVYIKNTSIKCAFVSTNSITQGEQVAPLWTYLLSNDISINFAYRTFRWDSEASIKAHVHCVIVGFSNNHSNEAILYDESNYKQIVDNINPYLVGAPSVIVNSRNTPICNVPIMQYGSMPIDNGFLILDKDEKDKLINDNPNCSKYIKEYMGGAEIIKQKKRWCLWLVDANPSDLKTSIFIMDRIKQTKLFREQSDRPQTIALANTPHLFGEIRQPNTSMLVIPKVSSESRRYIPIVQMDPSIIINGSALIVPNADLYNLGILNSNVHMAWMRTVCGRMKSDYQYSANVVYNNFPWPSPTPEQKAKIETTAQGILDARNKYPESTLADLYDELTMPLELRRAHQANDKAVMEAYGFNVKMTEPECVAELMKMYQKLTEVK